ncbi:jg8106 [Pararge aegeria aegeria]|uniref:Jg8106 protein n=1 Tax=Pararge aegeria aegeria TaxID=348720 RepID=A0A8S4SA12_9NEOP|nr:jg8106 [Pararge aegeria aegeria]
MLADGEIVGDGSWNLTIYVTDMNEKRTMVVKGDMHIGGVMLKLTESFENKLPLLLGTLVPLEAHNQNSLLQERKPVPKSGSTISNTFSFFLD